MKTNQWLGDAKAPPLPPFFFFGREPWASAPIWQRVLDRGVRTPSHGANRGFCNLGTQSQNHNVAAPGPAQAYFRLFFFLLFLIGLLRWKARVCIVVRELNNGGLKIREIVRERAENTIVSVWERFLLYSVISFIIIVESVAEETWRSHEIGQICIKIWCLSCF